MHNKIIVVDDTVITGSYNFSRNAQENAENILLIESPRAGRRLSDLYPPPGRALRSRRGDAAGRASRAASRILALLALGAALALARRVRRRGGLPPLGIEFRQRDQLRGGADSAERRAPGPPHRAGFRSEHANLSRSPCS